MDVRTHLQHPILSCRPYDDFAVCIIELGVSIIMVDSAFKEFLPATRNKDFTSRYRVRIGFSRIVKAFELLSTSRKRGNY
jgi:hypothetical protein